MKVKNFTYNMNAGDIKLVKTCCACPEQYDAFDQNGNQVAYLRLRHGCFTVECPDVGGEIIYSGEPNGDGRFEDDERDMYLSAAKEAIARYHSCSTSRRIIVRLSCFVHPFGMEIPVPNGRDAEEYIDEFLDSVLAEDFRYNCEWDFLDE